mgnify:CR=1 FL=1
MRLHRLGIALIFVTPVAAQQTKAVEQMAQSVGVIGLFFLLALSSLVVIGWVALMTALLPDWVRLKADLLQRRQQAAFGVGLVLVLALTVLAALLGQGGKVFPPLGILAVVLVLVLLTLLAVGWVAVVWLVGQRVVAVSGWELPPFAAALLGALVLHWTAFLPVVGWAIALYFAFVAVGLWFLR